MKIGQLTGDKYAYATYVGTSASIHHEMVRVWGKVFDCYDRLMPIGHPVYLWITIGKGELEEALDYGRTMSPYDLRSLDMIKTGCCPPGLVNVFLEGKEL